MAHNNDKDLKNTLEEKIKECKKALERHTSMSHETLQTIDTKLKTLEDRFSDWKKGQGKSNVSTETVSFILKKKLKFLFLL